MSQFLAPVHLGGAAILIRILPVLAFLLLAGFMPARIASAQAFDKVWQIVDPGLCSGCGGSSLVDLNGDGRDEIITTGGPHEWGVPYAMVYERDGNDFALRWTSAWSEGHQISMVSAADHGFGADGPEIYVLQGNGVLDAYDGQNFVPLWSQAFALNGTAKDALIADIDDDGRLEVVIAADLSVAAFDLESADLEWEFAAEWSVEVRAGDVDGDGALDVVVSAGERNSVGYVLDGRTGTARWTYYGGFGRSMLLKDVTGDGVSDVIGQSQSGMVTAFDVVRKTPAWQIGIQSHSPRPWIRFRDVDADGSDELVVALASGEVRAYAAAGDRSLLWTKQLAADDQAIVLDLGDTDGNGAADFVAQRGYHQPRLVSGSLDDATIVWTSERRTGPFHVIQGDVDGDLIPEVAVVNARSDRGIYYTIDMVESDGSIISAGEVDWLPNLYPYPRALTDLDLDGKPEIVFRSDGLVGIIDVATGHLIREWRTSRTDGVTSGALAVGDVDGDGLPEIAVADGGIIRLLDGRTLEAKWNSIDIGQSIQRMWIMNTDDDPAAEVVFWNHALQAYDGLTGTLDWQMPLEDHVTTLAVGDVNRDGVPDAVVGDYQGMVRIVDGRTHEVVAERKIADWDVWGISIANVDETEAPEIIVSAGALHVLRSSDLQSIWTSEPHGQLFDRVAGLQVADVDDNGRMDILYATEWGIFRFESQGEYLDTTHPFIASTHPKQTFERAGVDLVPSVNFSESIVRPSATAVRMTADGRDLPFDLQYDDSARRLSVAPRDSLPADASIEIVITTAVTDLAGLPLDGNRNGRPDGSPADDYVLLFTTGSSVDVTGPVVHVSVEDLGEIWQGEVIDLRVLAADTSSVATSNIAYVELFVDEEGEAGTGRALNPAAGRYDAPLAEAFGRIRTEPLTEGPHRLVIRARDAADNWGDATILQFSVRSWQRDAWTTVGGSASRSGSSSSDVRPPFSARWTVPLGEMGSLTPPVVADGRVYLGWIGMEDGFAVSAYEIGTGEEAWRWVLGTDGFATGLTYAYGRIYLYVSATSNGSRVLALDAGTGALLWDTLPVEYSNGNWHGAPVAHDGMVVVGGDLRLVAMDARSGSIVWRVNESSYDTWMPAAADGVVYSFWENQLVAYDVVTGERLWRLDVPLNSSFGSQSTVIIDPHTDLLYLATPWELAAVDRHTHEIAWQVEGNFYALPAVDALALYAVIPGHLQIYDKASGALSREVAHGQDVIGGPLLVGEHVYVQGPDRSSAIEKTTGEVVWSSPVGGQVAVADGHAFISRASTYYEQNGGLYAFIDAVRVDAEPDAELPATMALQGNYPNPFNPTTTIAFTLAESSRMRLTVYDVVGREVVRLVDETRVAGSHEVVFDAGTLPSGVYFVRLEAGGRILSKPVTLLK